MNESNASSVTKNRNPRNSSMTAEQVSELIFCYLGRHVMHEKHFAYGTSFQRRRRGAVCVGRLKGWNGRMLVHRSRSSKVLLEPNVVRHVKIWRWSDDLIAHCWLHMSCLFMYRMRLLLQPRYGYKHIHRDRRMCLTWTMWCHPAAIIERQRWWHWLHMSCMFFMYRM